MRGGAGGGRGRGGGRPAPNTNARGYVANQMDFMAETGKDLGLYSIYQAAMTEKPPPLFPERAFKKFTWPKDANEEDQLILDRLQEMRDWTAASAFNIDTLDPEAEVRVKGGVAKEAPQMAAVAALGATVIANAGAKRLFSALSDVLYTQLFPVDLVKKGSSKKRSRKEKQARERRNSFGDDVDALERKEKAAGAEGGEEGEEGEEGAAGGGGKKDAGAPLRRRSDSDAGDEAVASGDEEELDEEDEEDFNDYAEDHYKDDEEDGGDDDGGREAEY